MKSCSRAVGFASLLAMIRSLALRHVVMLPCIPATLIVNASILLLKQLAPVDIGKEVVRLGSCGIVGTKTTLVIEIKQVHQRIPSNSITAREGQRLLQDLAVHFVQHPVEPDTKGPLIHGFYESIAKGQGVPEYHNRLVQVSDCSSVKCTVRMVDQQRE